MKCYFDVCTFLQVYFEIIVAVSWKNFNRSICQSPNKVIFLKFILYKYYTVAALGTSYLSWLVHGDRCTTDKEFLNESICLLDSNVSNEVVMIHRSQKVLKMPWSCFAGIFVISIRIFSWISSVLVFTVVKLVLQTIPEKKIARIRIGLTRWLNTTASISVP
jgi:hypothetical protein